MAKEILFENGRISNFQEIATLTLTLDRVTLHTVVHYSSTSTYVAKFHRNRRNLLWVDRRMYVRPTLLGQLRRIDLKSQTMDSPKFQVKLWVKALIRRTQTNKSTPCEKQIELPNLTYNGIWKSLQFLSCIGCMQYIDVAYCYRCVCWVHRWAVKNGMPFWGWLTRVQKTMYQMVVQIQWIHTPLRGVTRWQCGLLLHYFGQTYLTQCNKPNWKIPISFRYLHCSVSSTYSTEYWVGVLCPTWHKMGHFDTFFPANHNSKNQKVCRILNF